MIRKTIIALMLIIPLKLFSTNRTLYYMEDVSQRIFMNASFYPKDYLTVIGLPGLSNVQLEAGLLGIKYSNYVSVENDVKIVNLSKLNDDIFLFNIRGFHDTNLDILSFGSNYNSTYFSFRIGVQSSSDVRIKKDFVDMVVNGNTPGKSFKLGPIINFGLWSYIDFGLSTAFNPNFRAGFRAKILGGITSMSTKKNQMTLTTDQTDNSISIDYKYKLVTSTILRDPVAEHLDYPKLPVSFNIESVISPFSNPGVGLDFGFEYRLNRDIHLSASLTDLGVIYFKTEPLTIDINKRATFKQIFDMSKFRQDLENGNVGSAFDTLKNKIGYKENAEITEDSYFFFTPVKFFFGSKGLINNTTSATLLYHFQLYGFSPSHSFTLGLNKTFFRGYSASLTYSYLYRRLDNIGLGLNARLGPVQFYLATDNLIGGIKLFNAYNKNSDYLAPAFLDINALNINFGLNINLYDYERLREIKNWNKIRKNDCPAEYNKKRGNNKVNNSKTNKGKKAKSKKISPSKYEKRSKKLKSNKRNKKLDIKEQIIERSGGGLPTDIKKNKRRYIFEKYRLDRKNR